MNSRNLLLTCLTVLMYCLPMAVALFGPAVYWHGGVIGEETIGFIEQHTANRPLLQKIFDPQENENGAYQARELSYFFDYVDAKAYFFIQMAFGRVLFIPLSATASSLLLVLVFAFGVRQTTDNVNPVTSVLLLTCLLTSFVFVSTMGLFYRSGKPLMAPVVLAYLFFVYAVNKRRNDKSDPRHDRLVTSDGVISFCLACFAGLLDRQGVFYALVACAILFVHYRLTHRLRDVLISTGFALVLLQMYNLIIAPSLIRTLNGYWPDFWLQRFSPSIIRRLPLELADALRMLVENAAILFGGFQFLGLLVWTIVIALLIRSATHIEIVQRPWAGLLNRLRYKPKARTLAYSLFIFGSQVVMFALMIEKHPPVYQLDHRYHYNTMPYLAVTLFGLLLLLDAAMQRVSIHARRWVSVILLMLAISNVLSLNHYRDIMRHGPYYGPVLAQSELLKASLRSGLPDPRLDEEYRQFFDYDRRLSSRANAIEGK